MRRGGKVKGSSEQPREAAPDIGRIVHLSRPEYPNHVWSHYFVAGGKAAWPTPQMFEADNIAIVPEGHAPGYRREMRSPSTALACLIVREAKGNAAAMQNIKGFPASTRSSDEIRKHKGVYCAVASASRLVSS